MGDTGLRIMAVAGSLKKESVSRTVLKHLAADLEKAGCDVDFFDATVERLDFYNPDSTKHTPEYRQLQPRVEAASVFILGTPDYHGSISAPLKNFLDHFWGEFAGKLFVPIVASHEKGLTTIDQIRTIARQCYAWVLPYAASAVDEVDVSESKVVGQSLKDRLEIMARDIRVYGTLLARQRAEDLSCADCTFLAKHRKK